MPDFSLEFDAISLSRGERPLLSGLNLSIARGELVWIRGSNGIGKSSLLRLAAGLLRPDSGHVVWNKDGAPCGPAQIISYQGHNDPLKPTLTVAENLSFWADAMQSGADIDAALDAVNLTEFTQARAGTLSAGQSRRAVLAKLLIENKPIWIMDEPAAAMDAAGVDIIDALIAGHIERGGAILLASHAAPRALTAQTRLLTLSPSEAMA